MLQKDVSPKGAVTVYQETTAVKGETSSVADHQYCWRFRSFPWDIQVSTIIRWNSKISTSSDKRQYTTFQPIREVRKRTNAAKKSRHFMGDATSRDISTVLISKIVRKKILSLSLTGRRFEFNVLKVIMLEMGRQGPLMSPFLNVSHYPRKKNKWWKWRIL